MTQTIYLFLSVLIVAAAMAIYWHRRSQEPIDKPDQGRYIQGLKALLRGQSEQAFGLLKETVQIDTGNIDAYIHLGNIFRRMKKYDQAIKVHRDLTHRGNLSDIEKREILLALYKDFAALGDNETAVKAIKELLVISPNDFFGTGVLLRHLETAEEWKEAAQVRRRLDKIQGVDSKKILALYKVFEGNNLQDKGDRHRARLFYKESMHIDKNCLAAYVAIGDSYYDEQRLDEALEYWNRVIAQKPDGGQVVFERLKKGYFETGHYGEYANTLSNLLQAFPEHLTARLELAYFLEKKGDVDAAREHFIAAQDNHPDSLMAKMGLYRLNITTDRKEAATNTFKQILKIAVKNEARTFKCGECGLIAESKKWLCSRCKAVDSFNTADS